MDIFRKLADGYPLPEILKACACVKTEITLGIEPFGTSGVATVRFAQGYVDTIQSLDQFTEAQLHQLLYLIQFLFYAPGYTADAINEGEHSERSPLGQYVASLNSEYHRDFLSKEEQRERGRKWALEGASDFPVIHDRARLYACLRTEDIDGVTAEALAKEFIPDEPEVEIERTTLVKRIKDLIK